MSRQKDVSVEEMARCVEGLGDSDLRSDEITALIAARDYILAAHAILGPKCPKCGHFLKVQHRTSWNPAQLDVRWYCFHRGGAPDACACEFYRKELFSDYPETAKEMGLS